MDEPEWNDLKIFLAVAEAGSLSAAALTLRRSQPTLGRSIDALEARLGVVLFRRGTKGMRLTESGEALLEEARVMREAATRLSLRAAGQAETLSGTVRITAAQIVATYHLPQIIAPLLAEEPGLEIEIVADDSISDLSQREADIAIRMTRPNQQGLIVRKVTELAIGLYASHDYLERHGEPEVTTFEHHMMPDFDRNPLIRNYLQEAKLRPRLRCRTDDQIVHWRLVLAGGGIGAQHRAIGDAEPGVRRVLPEVKIPSLPVWLACHEELRSRALIRRVFDYLGQKLAAIT